MVKKKDVKILVDDILGGLPRKECRTCDCFLGFLTQLELDSVDDVTEITAPLKVPREEVHGCLGCNPCPPAQAFSTYIKTSQKSKQQG